MTETKKLTADDLKTGDKVTFTLPSGKHGEGVIATPGHPFCKLEDGRKVRPGACTIAA